MNGRATQRVGCLSCYGRTERTWREDDGFGVCRLCGGALVPTSHLPNALTYRQNQKAKRELREQEERS